MSNAMSRQSKSEYITVKRERYGCTKKRKTKSRIIDEVVETLGFERKYAIRLLTGNRTFRPHKGRGKAYSDEAIALLIDLWRRANEPNSKYFKAQMARLLRDLRAVRNVPERLAQELLRMSASTIERNLKGLARKPLGALRKTYRAKESKSLAFVEVGSGERIPACDVEPGDIQVDTAALCGGDLRDNFIWVLTLTDRRTQWTEIRAVWNKGAEGIFAALEEMLASFPFRIYSLHYDNGAEFMNAHLVRFAQRHPNLRYARSRTGRCNDNAHVEQKNESVVRKLFGYRRFDDPGLLEAVNRLCRQWSEYNNPCVVSCMTLFKTQRTTRKGYTHHYDTPATPAERVLRHNGLTVRHRKALERRFRETNALLLFDQLSRSLTRLCRKQETHRLRQQAQADAPHLIEWAAHPLEHPAPLPPDTPPNTSPRPPPSILQCPVNDEHLPTPLTPSVSFLFDE